MKNNMLTEARKQEIQRWEQKGLIKLQLWTEEHEPDPDLKWEKDWWKRIIFIRTTLLEEVFGYKYEIIGTHYSKSIECPVILVKYRNVEIVLQFNFYFWQVMVSSKRAIKLDCDLKLIHADYDYFYYQGIPENYCFKEYSETNNKKFAICIDDNLMHVYAFMIMLKTSIDVAANKKVNKE